MLWGFKNNDYKKYSKRYKYESLLNMYQNQNFFKKYLTDVSARVII